METIIEIFSNFQENLDYEQNKRETLKTLTKDIEENTRKIITILQIIHQKVPMENILESCKRCKIIINNIKQKYFQLMEHVGRGIYFKYYDHWKLVTQKLCFIIALIFFLENGTLISRDDTARTLGLSVNENDNFPLVIEDYLFGLLALVSELSRYAVNAVTNGDYSKPIQISHFVAELNAGFRLLNLKNDTLRKRYDALKYDVKKIEEVVYDLSIRGLNSSSSVVAEETDNQ